MARKTRPATKVQASRGDAGELVDGVDRHVRRTVEEWPQIDPEVEGIVTRIHDIHRLLHRSWVASLAQAGLTYEEYKVLISLHNNGQRSHGALSRDLMVSTGAMTNRLDKLEAAGLVRRERDPGDRRGVLLELTPEGRKRLDTYIDIGAAREIELLQALSLDEKRRLNDSLRHLLLSLQAELGPVSKPTAGPEDTGS
jgi:DNA-binding MarR family transcriptional regulator